MPKETPEASATASSLIQKMQSDFERRINEQLAGFSEILMVMQQTVATNLDSATRPGFAEEEPARPAEGDAQFEHIPLPQEDLGGSEFIERDRDVVSDGGSGEITAPPDGAVGTAFDTVEVDYSTVTHILRCRTREKTVSATGDLTYSAWGAWTTIFTGEVYTP